MEEKVLSFGNYKLNAEKDETIKSIKIKKRMCTNPTFNYLSDSVPNIT